MIITPTTNDGKFLTLSNGIFLAGPCPREDFEDDWRKDAIVLLQEMGYNGDIISPTNPNYDGCLEKQTKWELTGLHLASQILFWIPRNKKHPAFTTNIELGEWMNNDSVLVGFPPESENNRYIAERMKIIGKEVYTSLQDICAKAVLNSKNGGMTYFTSDTHFSAERTLQLSYRPFRNVLDMDITLISNWNKRVNANDTVIHLGDFGNPDVVSLLNFKKMYFLMGNYEKKDHSIIEGLKKDKRVIIIQDNQDKKIKINGKEYYLCHEPLNSMGEDKFYLYGHIHRLQMVKKNGINVGIDGNRFKPMSVSEIEFLRNGIENHFDNNVFTDKCF